MVVISGNAITINSSVIEEESSHLKINANNIFCTPFTPVVVNNKVDLNVSTYTDFLINVTNGTTLNFMNIESGHSGKIIINAQCSNLTWTLTDTTYGIYWKNKTSITDVTSSGKIINYHVFDSHIILFSYS